MEKKLTAQGPKDRKSYTITLPLDWIKSHNLHKVKKAYLEIVGNKIIISAKQGQQNREIIDINNYSAIRKVLPTIYRMGVDEIKIFYSNKEQAKKITHIINSMLIGYEIVDHKKDYLIVKDITKESVEEFKIILRRIFLLVLEFAENKEVNEELTNNIRKLINYCQRILIKKGHWDYLKVPFYYCMLEELEKILDEYDWLYGVNTNCRLISEVNIIMRKAYELFYKFNAKDYSKYVDLSYDLKNKIKLTNKHKLEDVYLSNIARRLNSLYGHIFAISFKAK